MLAGRYCSEWERGVLAQEECGLVLPEYHVTSK